ncbi:MAG: metallophosphoesterase family protein [Verrucomicrobia bacterium]|nr:metallophosphoesterase family protein [Verrucomicrobiota bacterium]
MNRFLPCLVSVLLLGACARQEATVAPSATVDPSPRHLRIVWTEQPSTHAIVSWTTMSPTTKNVVHYDTVSRGGDVASYRSRVYASRNGTITLRAEDRKEGVPPGWYHHAEIDGLSPSTRVYMVVESDGVLTEERYFVTAPADDRPFKLLSGGDSRMGGEKPRYAGRTPHVDRRAMNRRMAELLEENPDLLAMVHGADWCTTADWRHLYWWFEDNELLQAADGRLLPFIVSRGNHDEGIGFQENFWLGDITDANSAAYYFTTLFNPQTALITLNTEISVAGDQLEFLEKQLAELRPAKRWLLVQYHRPAYPVAKDFNEHTFARVRQTWSPLFEKFNVDLVLESDGHVLKRTVPIRNNAFAADGIVYIGEGGLGVPQRQPRPNLWFVEPPGFAASAHHVWLLSFTAETLRMEAIGIDGAVLDSHSLSPRP